MKYSASNEKSEEQADGTQTNDAIVVGTAIKTNNNNKYIILWHIRCGNVRNEWNGNERMKSKSILQ